MNVSELIYELEKLKELHGDIRVVCAPYSYLPEAHEQLDRWWRSLSWIGRWMRRNDPEQMTRTPEPSAWGTPGMGSAGQHNPAREITL